MWEVSPDADSRGRETSSISQSVLRESELVEQGEVTGHIEEN